MLKAEERRSQRFRGSPLALRIGSTILGLFVLGYLLVISISRLQGPTTPHVYIVLGCLWVLAIGALLLLAKAWRATTPKSSP